MPSSMLLHSDEGHFSVRRRHILEYIVLALDEELSSLVNVQTGDPKWLCHALLLMRMRGITQSDRGRQHRSPSKRPSPSRPKEVC